MTDVETVFNRLASRQHGVAAVWQMIRLRVPRTDVDEWVREHRDSRVHRGVYGTPTLLGRFMAAALAVGPGAAVSHLSGLRVWAMRPQQPEDEEPHPVEVSAPGPGGRRERDGMVICRRQALERVRCLGIPVTTPTQSLLDARLPRHEAYRALEAAEQVGLKIDWDRLRGPELHEVRDVLRLGLRPTRSDAEARFLFLCRDHGIEMPIVNSMLNGVETDFHWPRARLVVEVDGWEFHKEREAFERDRDRGLIHRISGWEVIRVSASQLVRTPAVVAAAVREGQSSSRS